MAVETGEAEDLEECLSEEGIDDREWELDVTKVTWTVHQALLTRPTHAPGFMRTWKPKEIWMSDYLL
jgi:hypothetical protein